MRFEAKKKALSSAVAQVRVLADALSVTSGNKIEALHIVTDKKGLHLKSVAGVQVVEATVSEVSVEEPGSVVVDLKALAKALSVAGDTFKLSSKGKNLTFSCGRANGSLPLLDNAAEEGDLTEAPKATLLVPSFKSLLQAAGLKVSGKNADRTLHINETTRMVTVETTDGFRAVSAVCAIPDDAKVTAAAALSLPSKVMDSIASLLSTDALIGFNEKFFTVRAPGLYICLPQASTSPLNLAQQQEDWFATMDKFAEYDIKVADLRSAIDDAIALADDDRLVMALNATTGVLKTEGKTGKVEVDFDLKSDTEGDVQALILPSFLKECLSFFSPTTVIKATLYTQALHLAIEYGTDDPLHSQSIIIPLLAPAEGEAEKKPVKPVKKAEVKAAKKAPPKQEEAEEEEEEEEEEAPPPPKPVKKATTKVKDPEPEEEEEEAPPPKAATKKAPPKQEPEEEEEEEEAPAPPKKTPPPKEEEDEDEEPAPPPKKQASKPKAPPASVDPDDEEEDDESFDDEE